MLLSVLQEIICFFNQQRRIQTTLFDCAVKIKDNTLEWLLYLIYSLNSFQQSK